MKKISLIITLIAFLAMLYINYLSGVGKINNISAGGVSGLYPTFFTPAGFTFSIWGVIYFFNLLFIIYALVTGFSRRSEYPSDKIIYRYLLSCLVNIAWIFAWHYQAMILAMCLMIIFLFLLFLL